MESKIKDVLSLYFDKHSPVMSFVTDHNLISMPIAFLIKCQFYEFKNQIIDFF